MECFGKYMSMLVRQNLRNQNSLDFAQKLAEVMKSIIDVKKHDYLFWSPFLSLNW